MIRSLLGSAWPFFLRISSTANVLESLVPQGTQVYLPAYLHHRDPRYFPGATEEFIPDRWIGPDYKINQTAFFPFSYGPANCVGRQLARREMLMIASILIQKFDMSFAPGFNDSAWPNTFRDYFIVSRGPLLVTLRGRQSFT